MQNLSSAGMKVDFEGKSHAQRKGFQALSGVGVENRAGTKANIGHRQHLRRRGKNKLIKEKAELLNASSSIFSFSQNVADEVMARVETLKFKIGVKV